MRQRVLVRPSRAWRSAETAHSVADLGRDQHVPRAEVMQCTLRQQAWHNDCLCRCHDRVPFLRGFQPGAPVDLPFLSPVVRPIRGPCR